jgi:uncharacterized SAM-binding protein YcdF (DUF218 family)
MIFSKKYVFESKSTRLQRYLKNVALTSFLAVSVYIISGFLFILIAQNENKASSEAFFQKSPDLIVVYTGQKGRIPYAVKLAKEYKQSNIFITGVYSKNTVESLIKPLSLSGDINPDLLQIDYLARNTVENVFATLRYLRKNTGFERVLIISHDYHIARIKLLMEGLRTKSDSHFKFQYNGVESTFDSKRSIMNLYKEVYKFFKAFVFILLWDSDFDMQVIN